VAALTVVSVSSRWVMLTPPRSVSAAGAGRDRVEAGHSAQPDRRHHVPDEPVAGSALSKTSFGQPRPPDRVHEGIDLMASLGQEIYAVDNGVLTKQTVDGAANATLSGNAWTLTMPDKTYYFYAHLSAFATGLAAGSTVIRGQLIGYVGDTGDPGPGNYHLHFEVHPKGGAAVDPFPLLTIPKSCTVVP
jgi:murein DD-endopeptidase MepM/ murein hydrolase activator NlpD